MKPLPYETEAALSQYLLFHYGSKEDLLPAPFANLGPQNSLHFPIRCVSACLDTQSLPPHAKALDLGCAVGRSSFELSRYCASVRAIDSSQAFIEAAKQIQQTGQCAFSLLEEGSHISSRIAYRPDGIFEERIEFECCSIEEMTPMLFDVVLAANILCRVKDPTLFLRLLPRLVAPGGQLILTTPYSWLEEFTPRSSWLGGKETIQKILESDFTLKRSFDLPFLLREHLRKYQWGVSHATLWHRACPLKSSFQ